MGMKWNVTWAVVIAAMWGLVLSAMFAGCGEDGAAAAGTAAETTDGGSSGAYAAVLAVGDCSDFGPFETTACDPSTSFTVDTGIPLTYGDGGASATYQAKVSYFACSYQYIGNVNQPGGPVSQKCIAPATAISIVGNKATPLTSTPDGWQFWAIGYCVPSCPSR